MCGLKVTGSLSFVPLVRFVLLRDWDLVFFPVRFESGQVTDLRIAVCDLFGFFYAVQLEPLAFAASPFLAVVFVCWLFCFFVASLPG